MTRTATPPDVFGIGDKDRMAIETLYRAFDEGDPDLLDRALSPGWKDIPLAPGQQPGREGMKPLIEGFAANFPDAQASRTATARAPSRGPSCSATSRTAAWAPPSS